MLTRCSQFGFDRKKIASRLAFLRLSKADHKLARRLHDEVIYPNVDTIIERFYEALLFHAESRIWLLDGNTIARLKKTQRGYLLSLGMNFDSDEYFEGRLHIGVVHALVGLPLHTYQCSYSHLIQYIIDEIPASIRANSADYKNLTVFITKITALDMSLAIETYHNSSINELEDAVKTALSRETRLLGLAETDALTGLYNQKFAFGYLDNAIKLTRQNQQSMCLLMLDIDHFKTINDTHGHQVGDEVIKKVAATLTNALRDSDIVGRYGGEEFIAGLMDVTLETAKQIAERIRLDVAKTVTTLAQQSICVSVSIGLARLNKNDDLESLIQRADSALYSAKSAGRNRVVSD